MSDEAPERSKKRCGFAAMDPDKQREIARKGGQVSQATGRGHRFTTATAQDAGRLGGLATARARRGEDDEGR